MSTPPRSTPPRRRRRLSADERREQLAEATVQVLATRGYRTTTTDAVVARAAVSKGLLWHYFSDLDELMEFTARRTLKRIATDIGAGLDLTAPAPEVIRAAVRRAAAVLHTHPAERAALQQIVANLRTADGTQRLTLEEYEDLYAAQEAIFRRGQDAGDFRSSLEPRVLAVTYQGAVDAMLDYLQTHPDVDPDRYASMVADVLLDGIREVR